MSRMLTDEELKWINSLKRCLKKMPSTISLFADGTLKIVDSDEYENYDKIKHFQALYSMGHCCGGGDPWC